LKSPVAAETANGAAISIAISVRFMFSPVRVYVRFEGARLSKVRARSGRRS
jgi:hypothetical protein